MHPMISTSPLSTLVLCAAGVAALTHCATAPTPDDLAGQGTSESLEIPTFTPTPAQTPPPTALPVALTPSSPAAPARITPQPTPVPKATPSPSPTVAPSPAEISFQNKEQPKPSAGARIGAGLDAQEVQNVFSREIARIRSCYEKGLKDFPAVEGRLTLDFSVGTMGRATSVRITRNSLESAPTEKCLTELVRSLEFPRPRGRRSVHVEYPLVLQWESNFGEVQKQLQGCWEATVPLNSTPITQVSLRFDRREEKPRAAVGSTPVDTQKKGPRNDRRTAKKGKAKSPSAPQSASSGVVVAYQAEVSAATLRANRLAMVLDVSSRKVGIAGQMRLGAANFVAVIQVGGKRTTMTFERKDCTAALVGKTTWLAESR